MIALAFMFGILLAIVVMAIVGEMLGPEPCERCREDEE